MLKFLILLRNIVLAAIMAWMGFQLTPADQDEEQAETPAEVILSGFLP